MAGKYPHADHLLNDEVDYELKLRSYDKDVASDLDTKRRLLRMLFKRDVKENMEYVSIYTIEQEFDLVSSRVNAIRDGLSKGSDIKLISRLKHYYWRIIRCPAADENSQQMKDFIIDEIVKILNTHSAKDPAVLADQPERHESSEEMGAVGGTSPRVLITNSPQERGKETPVKTPLRQGGNDSLGAYRKTIQNSSKRQNKDNEEEVERISATEHQKVVDELGQAYEMNRKLQNILQEMNNKMNMCMERNEQLTEKVKNLETVKIRQPVRSKANEDWSMQSKTTQHGYLSSLVESSWPWQNGARTTDEKLRNQRKASVPDLNRYRVPQNFDTISETSSEEEMDSTTTQATPQRRRWTDDRMQYDRRIEKWNIFFSGDSKSATIEDFIYKVKVLANMNGIPHDNLLSHIHLLLRGEAANWFFTYYDASWNWTVFEAHIRFRFGNPNQEQGNRQRIYDRKQQRGETFIAFVTEIERMNKLLNKPMSKRRKFEIVWENMRHHYRAKLACFSVTTLEELIHVNYKIDASDPSLHPIGPRHSVNNVELDSQESETESEEVNYINRRHNRQLRPLENRDKATQSSHVDNSQRSKSTPTCWNCNNNGHFWRDCREQKTIFCYVCGNPGKIVSNCERHPRNDGHDRTEGNRQSGN